MEALYEWQGRHRGERPWYVSLDPSFWRDLATSKDQRYGYVVQVEREEQREGEPFATQRRWMGIPILIDFKAPQRWRFFGRDEAFTRSADAQT